MVGSNYEELVIPKDFQRLRSQMIKHKCAEAENYVLARESSSERNSEKKILITQERNTALSECSDSDSPLKSSTFHELPLKKSAVYAHVDSAESRKFANIIARLWPSPTGFYLKVLKWCLLTANLDSSSFTKPSIVHDADIELLNPVPLKQITPPAYASVFTRLLINECATETRSSVLTSNFEIPLKAESIMVPHLLCSEATNGESLFLLVLRLIGTKDQLETIGNGNLVSLRCEQWLNRGSETKDDRNGHVLGIVQQWDPLMEPGTVSLIRSEQFKVAKQHKLNYTKFARVVVCVPGKELGASGFGYLKSTDIQWLQGHSAVLSLQRIACLITACREFQAIFGITRLPQSLQNVLFDPSLGSSRYKSDTNSEKKAFKCPDNIDEGLWRRVSSRFNPSQMEAILGSLSSSHTGITLIQGPPGTGKSTCILGIVSLILAGACSNNSSRTISKNYIPAKIIPGGSLKRLSEGKEIPKTVSVCQKKNIRILLCAPSNAAVDELLLKIKQGGFVWNEFGLNHEGINAVRISSSDNPCLAHLNIDSLMSKNSNVDSLYGQYEKNILERIAILRKAQIVCATLSSCGSQSLLEPILYSYSNRANDPIEFDAVIIDEAAQAVEPSCIIPFRFSTGTVIMVGDHCQLSATINSVAAKNAMYGTSLFERLIRGGHHSYMLTNQYRMHPEICAFPGVHFYGGKLKCISNGEQPQAFNYCFGYGPLCFYDIHWGKMNYSIGPASNKSYYNDYEVDFIRQHLAYFQAKILHKNHSLMGQIGIIAPYRSQIQRLKEAKLGSICGIPEDNIEIRTVDGFQGQEKDIIILCCVRAPRLTNKRTSADYNLVEESDNIGFLCDPRRLNVAITRAKTALWIVGHGETLSQGSRHWAALLDNLAQRNLVFTPPNAVT